MPKIPTSTKKFSQTNRSDVSGNIWYTKNIDFNEEGLIKLSPRFAQVISDSSLNTRYDTDFNISPSIGRYGLNGDMYFATIESPFVATLSSTSFTISQDVGSNVPTLASNSRARWWQNRWYVTTDTSLFYKTVASGNWTDASVSLTTGIKHPIEVFRNKTSMCVGNGNVVYLINTSHSTTVTLTIPADYEIVDIKYSNNKVGIITKLSTVAVGQNQEAFFFVWDGAATSANNGFPVGTNEIASIEAYKGSWVILTKSGQLLYFNGGGFQEIAIFPFFSKDRIWDTSMFGDTMLVDGDLIYININGTLNINGLKQETYLENNVGGIWCYDPSVGLYHKYSPSISQINSISVTDANVDIATDKLTTSDTIPATGTPIKLVFSTSNPIGGLNAGQIYYIIRASSTEFRIAETPEKAIAGEYINLTSIGASVNSFLALTIKDYGQSFLNQTGGMVTTDTKNLVYDGLMASYRAYNNVGTSVNYMGMLVYGFRNIGYYVTPRIESSRLTDKTKKVFIKYRPLNTDDIIIVKYKEKDIRGIPVATPQRGLSCTWTNNTTITVTGDFSEAETYLDTDGTECEVEIISGAGAGQISKISSISGSSGVYTITLSEEIDGVVANDTCNIIVNNWKEIGRITSEDTENYKEWALSVSSKSIFFKIILDGVDITIEEFDCDNETHIK